MSEACVVMLLCQLVGVWPRGPDDHDTTGREDMGHGKHITYTKSTHSIYTYTQGKRHDKPLKCRLQNGATSADMPNPLCVLSVSVC